MSLPTGSSAPFRRYELPTATPEMTVRAAMALLAGAKPSEVADWSSMSVRTAYRWRRSLRSIEHIRVNGWVAWFASFDGRQPVRLSAWERSA